MIDTMTLIQNLLKMGELLQSQIAGLQSQIEVLRMMVEFDHSQVEDLKRRMENASK